jgi:hypothetical protein
MGSVGKAGMGKKRIKQVNQFEFYSRKKREVNRVTS